MAIDPLEKDGFGNPSYREEHARGRWVDENSAKRVSVLVPDSFPFPTSLPLA